MILKINNVGSKKYPRYKITQKGNFFCITENYDIALSIFGAFVNIDEIKESQIDINNNAGKILQKIKGFSGIDLTVNLSQKREVVDLRFIFCRMAKNLRYTSTAIGEIIHREHVSVLSALKKFDDYYETDSKFRELYYDIKNYEL